MPVLLLVCVINAFVFLSAAIFLFPTVLIKSVLCQRCSQPGVLFPVMLTFDDGPDPLYTPRLLALLDQFHVRAVFFLVAEKAATYPEITAQIISRGHCIGLHGWHHHNMLFKGPRSTKKELETGLALLQKSLPGQSPVLWYRPPFGMCNLFTLYHARRKGLQTIFWNVITGDWSLKNTAPQIAGRLRRLTGPGSIILLHDSGQGTGGDPGAAEHTLAALEEFLPEILRKGCRFVLPHQCFLSWKIGKKGDLWKRKE